MWKITFALLSLGLLLQPTLSAAEVHGTLTLTTNNAYRWFSKSHNSVALQASLEYQHVSGLFLGGVASNVDFKTQSDNANAAQVEVVPYVGWTFKLSDQWRLDAQFSRYVYDGTVFNHQADYNEYFLFLHYKDWFSGRISFADNYYNVGHYAIDYELTGRYPLRDNLEFSASFGYNQTKEALGSDYPYWNIGITYFYKRIAVDLRYMDSSETCIDYTTEEEKHKFYNPTTLDATAVFSMSLGF